MATTTNYAFDLPVVGGNQDTWGGLLNGNWSALDTLLGGVTATEFSILDGATVTTDELNILDGVTATAAELNILDGATITTDELNYVDGVTSPIQTQLDAKYVASTQDIEVWEAGTDTTESLVSPEKIAAAIAAQITPWNESSIQTISAGATNSFAHGLSSPPSMWQVFVRCVTADGGNSVGDEMPIYPNNSNSGDTSNSKTWADASNIYFSLNSDGSLVGVTTLSRWRMFARWSA